MKHSGSAGRGKVIAVAIVVLAAAVLALALYSYIITENNIVRDTVAVVSDHSGKIVWVGFSQDCIPAANNTHMVYDCAKEGSGYSCSGIYYAVSSNQIEC
jgi:hypothetical protein